MFVILGDFNRRLDQDNDWFWRNLDDDMVKATGGRPQECPTQYKGQLHIDNIVLGGDADDLWDGNFREIAYDATSAPILEQLSDHCPLVVRLDLLNP